MDDIDQMLQGSDQAPASLAQNGGQPIDDGTGQPASQQTAEEVEFNKLSGSTRDRFKQAYTKLKEKDRELELLRQQQQAYVPPAPGSGFQTPEQQNAIRILADQGIATDEKVDRKLDERLNMLRWEQRQNSLESKYTGVNDEPQYVREEVEDFIRSHPQYGGYDPEDVFKTKMFPDEFMNLEIARRGTKTGRSQTLKPTSRMVDQQQGLTPEYIAERTDINKYPDAPQWQEEHRQEIDKVLSHMKEE